MHAWLLQVLGLLLALHTLLVVYLLAVRPLRRRGALLLEVQLLLLLLLLNMCLRLHRSCCIMPCSHALNGAGKPRPGATPATTPSSLITQLSARPASLCVLHPASPRRLQRCHQLLH